MHKAMEDLPERDAGRRTVFNYRFNDNGGSALYDNLTGRLSFTDND
jgi:hypothetical protein